MHRSTRTVAPAVATLALIARAACDAPSRGAGPAAAPSGASLGKGPGVGSPQLVDISNGSFSEALDINDLGAAVGYRDRSSSTAWGRATLWLPTGEAVDVPSLGLGDGQADAINNIGQVVGVSISAATGDNHAFLWTPGVGVIDLGTVSGATGSYSHATDINNRGWVAGLGGDVPATGPATRRAFRWTPDAGMQDIGSLGGALSQAFAINDNGQVAGGSNTAANAYHAFLWTPGRGMQDLGTLPGDDMSQATGVNSKGQVVGWSQNSTTGILRAFLWTSKTGMRLLPLPDGIANAIAQDINDNGQVAGLAATVTTTLSTLVPVIWVAGSPRVLDLPSFANFGSATAINNGGQVAGRVETIDGTGPRATLWR